MIAVEQEQPRGKLMPCPMGKHEIAPLEAEGVDDAVMSEAAKRKQGAQIGKCLDASDEKLAAGCGLFGERFVGGRHAAPRIGDHAIHELERVRRNEVMLSVRQSHLEQRAIEQLASIIP